MNYSAQQIQHVYKKVKQDKSNHLSNLKLIKPKEAHGNLFLKVDDIFNSDGDDSLKYSVVGYGGVNFLGNLNGKVPTQGLYYKNADIKHEVEKLIRFMEILESDLRAAVKYIQDQHGKPNPQHAILWQTA